VRDRIVIEFFVAGTPVTQGSKKIGRAGRFATLVETRDAELRPWREGVGAEARRWIEQHDTDLFPIAGQPVSAWLYFGLQRPASAPKKRRTWPISARSGDVDKLSRAILDAITGILIADDAQVVNLHAIKDYDRPGVLVRLDVVEVRQMAVVS
jgi:crossover junction endodeoxyribonuclease RusA